MSASDWLPLAQRVLSCEWADDGWCETHDDPWPCDRAQEAADVLAEELDQPTKEQKMGNDTPTQINPAESPASVPGSLTPPAADSRTGPVGCPIPPGPGKARKSRYRRPR